MACPRMIESGDGDFEVFGVKYISDAAVKHGFVGAVREPPKALADFSSSRGARAMSVGVKYTLFPGVRAGHARDWACPLPTPHEESSTAHRGHGPLVHKPCPS